jgi:hypothetical protein
MCALYKNGVMTKKLVINLTEKQRREKIWVHGEGGGGF